MKSITITVLIVAAVLCGTVMCDRNSEWAAKAHKCAQEHNVSADDLTNVMRGNIKPADVTQNQKCVLLCISESDGTMKDGVLQTKVLSQKISNHPNKKAIRKSIVICKDLKGVDNCDTAYKIMTCFVQNRTG